MPDLFRIFVTAQDEQCATYIVKRDGLSKEEAEKKMRRMDRARAANYNYYTNQKWGQADYYDLCLNLSTISMEKAAENEKIVGKELKTYRDKVWIATKFGVKPDDKGQFGMRMDASVKSIRESVENSLRYLHSTYQERDFRNFMGRLKPEVMERNQALLDLLGNIADKKNATKAQVALVWKGGGFH